MRTWIVDHALETDRSGRCRENQFQRPLDVPAVVVEQVGVYAERPAEQAPADIGLVIPQIFGIEEHDREVRRLQGDSARIVRSLDQDADTKLVAEIVGGADLRQESVEGPVVIERQRRLGPEDADSTLVVSLVPSAACDREARKRLPCDLTENAAAVLAIL